ncbi:PAS domain S-box protein [Domibacillus sp. 8LH]|uniref:PAS domain-containing protein n=1 Tax=Domibacillus sp. 8LH TaxID=3073900 RepID=UPI00317AA0F9
MTVFCALCKYEQEEIIGQKHSLFDSGMHPDDYFDEMWHMLKRGQVWQSELHNRAKDGSIYSIHATVVPIQDENGHLAKFLSIDMDIADKIQAEAALKQALKNEFQTTARHLQNAVFKYRKNEDGQIVLTMLEGKLLEKMGLAADWADKSQLKDIVSKQASTYISGYVERAFTGEQVNFEVNILHFSLLVHLSPLFEGEKVTEVIGTATDITERKETERQV